MKYVLSFAALFITITGIYINFPAFAMGSTATLQNFSVTFTYVALWIWLIVMTYRNNYYTALRLSCMFWILTAHTAVLTAIVNAVEINIDWSLPIVIICLTQWYGVELLVNNFYISSIIIAIFSFFLFVMILILLRKERVH